MDRLVAMSVQDTSLDRAQSELEQLGTRVQCATELQDLVELQEALGHWQICTDNLEAETNNRVLPGSFRSIMQGEKMRRKLQGLVDEAERRFDAKRWDALKSSVERLNDVHVEDSTWERWKSALQREMNFSIIKAVSGASRELKRQLYSSRLRAALQAERISLGQLEALATAAEAHQVSKIEVDRARNEIDVVRQRWQCAQEAMDRKVVDTADVNLWKLQKSRVYIDEWTKKQSPLFHMASAIKNAEAAKDWLAMKEAIEGWREDKPGTNHPAFEEEDSFTNLFRSAPSRADEFQLAELRQELNDALNSIKDGSQKDPRSELRRSAQLMREMISLGWQLAPNRSARLLSLSHKVHAEGGWETSVARFSEFMLQALEGLPQVVFLLDQSIPQHAAEVKAAVAAVTKGFGRHVQGTRWAGLVYGPVQVVQDSTSDLDAFTAALQDHSFAKGHATTSQGLRAAKDVFKDETHPRIIFHVMSGAAENSKDAHKAFRVIEAMGITALGICIGKSSQVDKLMKFSSPGLAFKVEDPARLTTFIADAFKEVDRMLAASNDHDPEQILSMLEA